MALPLLLPDPSTVVRYGELGRRVLQCLHEVHFMERALSVFQGALLHSDLEDCSSSPALSAFDPHVGDCACETRAQMLWDLVIFYRTAENKAHLLHAIACLKKIRVNAALLLDEIELSHGKPRSPNLSVLLNNLAIWQRIGFHSFLDLAPTTSPTDAAPNESPDPTDSPSGRKRSAHKRRDLAISAAWNPRDIVSVTRFLTMCHLLSEFKIATIESGPPTRVKVRVDLQAMYERNAGELAALQLTANKAPNYGTKVLERMTQQTEVMQIYVARVTTDWVRRTALKEQNIWSSFPEEFIATNNRRITCVSAYVSLLLVRNAWMKHDIPIFAMIQHFCEHGGYRNIYFRIVPNPMAEISKKKYSALGDDCWFTTQEVSLDEVTSSSWGKLPHTIMIGMSCQGTTEDFKRRLLESQQGLLPLAHRCDQATHLAQTITRINFSRLLAHCYAQDSQFPFTLRGLEDEFTRVASALNNTLGEEAEAAFTEARFGADEFGTGRSTWLGTLEHVFLEYPRIVAKDVQEYGEKPRVWGCTLE